MTETMMPMRRGGLDAGGSLASWCGCSSTKRNWVEDAMTSTVKKDFLRGLVLNKEKELMKFDKHIIITHKTINGKKVFANVWNMKDITQVQR
jgi:hypothetical protein